MVDSIDKTNIKDLIKDAEKIKDIIQPQQTITDINDRINDWEIRLSEMRGKYYDLDTDKIKNDINTAFAKQKEDFNNEINNLRKMFWIEVCIGILAILVTFIFAIKSIPNEFIVKNNLSKEDIKDIIQYTYQQQSNKKNNH